MRCLDTTRSVMLDVIIALIPAAIWGIYSFGWRAAVIILISVAVSVLTEAVYEVATRKSVTCADLSAAVTGLILGLYGYLPSARSSPLSSQSSFSAVSVRI